MIRTVGALSRLFSDSIDPYLHSRAAENLFCRSFSARNHSRSDLSVDASKENFGIGIKTFLDKSGNTLQKVAEFNSDHESFRSLDRLEKAMKIAELRNARLENTRRILRLDKILYHCLSRGPGEVFVFETPMDMIAVDKINNVKVRNNSFFFDDGLNEYSFNVSKSTLYKRFERIGYDLKIAVNIINDPISALEGFLHNRRALGVLRKERPFIFLPLYSRKGQSEGRKFVPEKSGLNQWNASGRPRDPNEVYIPIPREVHNKAPGFFPSRESEFKLRLPDGKELRAKVCQDGDKALMTNPNSALGQWLLRDVLDLKERELLTYRTLEKIGLDSVSITRESPGDYSINFNKINSYEEFLSSFSDGGAG